MIIVRRKFSLLNTIILCSSALLIIILLTLQYQSNSNYGSTKAVLEKYMFETMVAKTFSSEPYCNDRSNRTAIVISFRNLLHKIVRDRSLNVKTLLTENDICHLPEGILVSEETNNLL